MNQVQIAVRGIPEPEWKDRLSGFCLAALRVMGIDNWEVSLLLCDDATIAELNRSYRGKTGPTDVLAFRQDDGVELAAASPHPAGDIVISLAALGRQAEEYGATAETELKRILIHGLLHLKGMEHDKDDDAMIARQEQILSRMNEETVF